MFFACKRIYSESSEQEKIQKKMNKKNKNCVRGALYPELFSGYKGIY